MPTHSGCKEEPTGTIVEVSHTHQSGNSLASVIIVDGPVALRQTAPKQKEENNNCKHSHTAVH